MIFKRNPETRFLEATKGSPSRIDRIPVENIFKICKADAKFKESNDQRNVEFWGEIAFIKYS